jgi:hypothetical protein
MISKDKMGKGEYLRKWKAKHREKTLFQQAHYRAKTKKIPFDIEISDIIIPEICPILQIPLKKTIDGDRQHSPSLDRIDNDKGYTKGNIQVISNKANSMKHAADKKELQNFAQWIKLTYGE